MTNKKHRNRKKNLKVKCSQCRRIPKLTSVTYTSFCSYKKKIYLFYEGGQISNSTRGLNTKSNSIAGASTSKYMEW